MTHQPGVYVPLRALFLVSPKQHMSYVMRKPVFCLCENKDADHLLNNCSTDQRFCFHNIDNSIPLLTIYKI